MLAAQVSKVFFSSTNPLFTDCCQKELIHIVPYPPSMQWRNQQTTTADPTKHVLFSRTINRRGLGLSSRSKVLQGAVQDIVSEHLGEITQQGATQCLPGCTRKDLAEPQ